MPRKMILQKKGSSKGYFIRGRVAIVNYSDLRTIAITKDLMLDTGFTGGIHIPIFHLSDAKLIGVEPRPSVIRLGGGRKEADFVCLGHVEEIDGYVFPRPGIETEIHLHGNEQHGYVGLDVLKEWLTKFDGPKSVVSIFEYDDI